MGIFEVLSLLCGLALFLYGMDVMGESLKKSAGSRLKAILAKMTSSPLRGFLCFKFPDRQETPDARFVIFSIFYCIFQENMLQKRKNHKEACCNVNLYRLYPQGIFF